MTGTIMNLTVAMPLYSFLVCDLSALQTQGLARQAWLTSAERADTVWVPGEAQHDYFLGGSHEER